MSRRQRVCRQNKYVIDSNKKHKKQCHASFRRRPFNVTHEKTPHVGPLLDGAPPAPETTAGGGPRVHRRGTTAYTPHLPRLPFFAIILSPLCVFFPIDATHRVCVFFSRARARALSRRRRRDSGTARTPPGPRDSLPCRSAWTTPMTPRTSSPVHISGTPTGCRATAAGAACVSAPAAVTTAPEARGGDGSPRPSRPRAPGPRPASPAPDESRCTRAPAESW